MIVSILCRRFGGEGGVWKSTSKRYIADTSSVYKNDKYKASGINTVRNK